MKKLFFILTFLFISQPAFGQLTDAQKKCMESPVNPTVNFYSSYGRLSYDFTKNTKEVHALSEEFGHLEQGLFAHGLAIVTVVNEVALSTSGQFLGDNNICVIPASLDVFIGYNNPVIYVSRELKKDSCEFEQALRHEKAHQQIHKTALDYFLPQISHAVQRISRDVKPVLISDISQMDQAAEYLTKQYMARTSIITKRFKEEILKEQAKLDSIENYRMEGELCRRFNKKR